MRIDVTVGLICFYAIGILCWFLILTNGGHGW